MGKNGESRIANGEWIQDGESRIANGEWRMANGKKQRIANSEWWDPGRGGSQTRPGCVVAPASCLRPIACGDGRGHSRTPICPTGKGRGTACRALTVTGVSQPPFVDTHLTVRMANGERRRTASGERRAGSGERRRIANGEWKETANSESRMANGGIRVGAGSQPALPRHGEAFGEDSKPGPPFLDTHTCVVGPPFPWASKDR
jgi:hypothetical protein